MKKIIPVLVFISLLFVNCSKDDDQTSGEFFHTIVARTFKMNTPKGWELLEDQGEDTYIGRIKNEDFIIFFDQGRLSFGDLDSVEENDATIYFTRLTINGVPAIIHKEYRPQESHIDTRLSVYLDTGEKKNRLSVLNSNNDEFFIRMIKTHVFL